MTPRELGCCGPIFAATSLATAARPATSTVPRSIVSELVTNAVRHAAGMIWVSVEWSGARPRLRVVDLGPGFDLRIDLPTDQYSPSGRGLHLVSHMTDDLEVRRRESGGSVVTAVLPVDRVPTTQIDPPSRRKGQLPALDEALPEGGFDRETFLRALVVQLAQTVTAQHGAAAADAAVAQVGIDVGGQMEQEYRLAKQLSGRLTSDQLADCFVRLKHAIGGGFSVVEVTETRIVLTNTRCPFGDVVRRAPALCRMTSAVFGGIAARNVDHMADVLLEERIAVGDPSCRIVIDLAPPTAVPTPWVHRYPTPA